MTPFGVTASTLGNPAFADLLPIARDAGYSVLSVWPMHTYSPARAAGWTPAAMRAALDDHGLRVHDVDALIAWVGPDDPGPPYFEESGPDELWEAAEALDVRCVNVLLTGRRRQASLDDAAEVLAPICDRAAEHGLLVTVEFALRSMVNGFAEAVELCRRTGRANARICLDTWATHFGGSHVGGSHVEGADLEALREGAGLVATIQINDVPSTVPDDLTHATRYHRLVPGEGAADLVGMVAALRAGGCDAPLVAEVFNDELLDSLGPEGFARRIADAVARIEGDQADRA